MRGCVKILADSADGRLVLLSFRMPGELIGELAPLDGQARSATGRAAGPVVTLAIGASALNEYLAAHPAADLAVRNRIVARLREATQKPIQVNNAAPVPRRLAWALCLLGERYGVPVADGVLIDAPLSQADIASLISTTEQSVRKALAGLPTRAWSAGRTAGPLSPTWSGCRKSPLPPRGPGARAPGRPGRPGTASPSAGYLSTAARFLRQLAHSR